MAGSAMRKFTGLKRTALAGSNGKSKGGFSKTRYPFFVVCIDARGYEGSLFVGKIYQVIRPQAGDLARDLRVVDEEGEDYLYSADRFVPIEVPLKAKRVLSGMS